MLNLGPMRCFQSLEEVRANLDTLTMEEMTDVYDRLGIAFELEDGQVLDAYYYADREERAERVMACG